MSQRYAFIDGAGVLVAHGFVESNGPGQTRLEVAGDFALAPGAWKWTGAEWEAYAAPVVRVATARQFKAALAIAGVISEAEVASPNLPAVAEPVVAQFPDAQRFVARSTWANMTVVPEDDPLLEAMRQAAGMTEAEKTELFDLALGIT